MAPRTVYVPAARLARWIEGFTERHGGGLAWHDGGLHMEGNDGHVAVITGLFPVHEPPVDRGSVTIVSRVIEQLSHPPTCAVLIVRRGGFAAAVVQDSTVMASKISRRHVQGRTAAGGWSQQRFARRRDNQAKALVEAAAATAAGILLPPPEHAVLVTGGDRLLVDDALGDPRLRPLARLPRGPHLAVGDPTREIIARLPQTLTEARIDLTP